jgi:hypothetical protein
MLRAFLLMTESLPRLHNHKLVLVRFESCIFWVFLYCVLVVMLYIVHVTLIPVLNILCFCRWFQLPLLSLVSHLFLYSTCTVFLL